MAEYPDAESGDTTETDPDMMEALAAITDIRQTLSRHLTIDIKVAWEWMRLFDRWDELWYFMKWARTNDKLPRFVQDMRLDPTKVQSTEDFKDIIREMYDCTRLGLEINKFMLTWKSHEGPFCYSSLGRGWDAAKDILLNPRNTNFVLYVVFQCVGDAGDELVNILESKIYDKERKERLKAGVW